MEALITNIQKYCIHDGDGIRTTVFFKGCPLRCAWCHNPETQTVRAQLLDQPERCTGCGACMRVCPKGAVEIREGKACTDRKKCISCGECTEVCMMNLREISGKPYTLTKLLAEVKKDEAFYEESHGGVTLSGGEVMQSDPEFLKALVSRLHREGISVYIDTCGYCDWKRLEEILPYADTFLYDLKVKDPVLHKKYTGVDNALILDNLKKLSAAGARIYLRTPVMAEVNGNEQAMQDIIDFLQENKIRPAKVCLLPYHNTGISKYDRLGGSGKAQAFTAPSQEEMEQFCAMFTKAGYAGVQIGG